jgi:hypothetical protein
MVFDLRLYRDSCVIVRTASHDQDRLWSSWSVWAVVKGSGGVSIKLHGTALLTETTLPQSRADGADTRDGDALSCR